MRAFNSFLLRDLCLLDSPCARSQDANVAMPPALSMRTFATPHVVSPSPSPFHAYVQQRVSVDPSMHDFTVATVANRFDS